MGFLSWIHQIKNKKMDSDIKRYARMIMVAVILPLAMIMMSHPSYVSAEAASVNVNIDPDAVAYGVGTTFAVDLAVTTVTDLNRFTVDISYNQAIIKITGTQGGTGIRAGYITDSTVDPIVVKSIPITWTFTSGSQGSVSIAGNLGATSGNGANGKGYLARLYFEVIGLYGQISDVAPVNIVLKQTTGALLTIKKVEGGTVEVKYPPVTVSIDTTTSVPAGDTFTANIDVSLVKNISAFQFDLAYDSTVLNVVDVTNGLVGSKEIEISLWSHPGGNQGLLRVLGVIMDGNPTTGSGTLAGVEFEAVGDNGESSTLTFPQSTGFSNTLFSYSKVISDVSWTGETVNLVKSYRITTTNPLPTGEVGIAYSKTLAATGGLSPYTYSIIGGTLPAGLTFASTGAITGTPTTATPSTNITFKVKDHTLPTGEEATKVLAITIVSNPSISTSTTLTQGEVNLTYSMTFAATGGLAAYTWSKASGTLPTGLTLTTAGVLSGVPTVAGPYTFAIKVTDSLTGSATTTFYLTIVSAPTISTTSPLPNGEKNIAYSKMLEGTGGIPPYSFALSSGTLPSGMTFSTAGLISGTPTVATTSTLIFRITDSMGGSSTKSFTLIIAAAPSISTASPLTQGEVNASYSVALSVTGGVSDFTFTQTAGTLTPGITLSSGGLLSGTPTTQGTYTFTVKVTDKLGATATKQFVHTILNALSISTSSPLTAGEVGIAYSKNFAATGGAIAYTWIVQSGSLPPGLSFTTVGLLSGTPTTAGTSSFIVQVTDSLGGIAIRVFSLTIAPAPTVSTDSPLPDGELKISYSLFFEASGGTSPFTWIRTAGALPSGLSLTTAGKLSGTPTTAGTSTFTVKATDDNGASAYKAFTLTVAPVPTILTTSPLTNGEVNIYFSKAMEVTGGVLPFSWKVQSGSLPDGLSLSTDGVISGTPTVITTKTFTLKATDKVGGSDTQALTLTIVAGPSITTAASLTGGGINNPYSKTLAATGGVGTYTWTQTAGTLPPGLNLSTGGIISGTPTQVGTYTFTIQVKDTPGGTASRVFTLTIAAGLTITTESPLDEGEINIAYSQTMEVIGGVLNYTWTQTSGTLPTGLTFSTAGKLSGTPTKAGTYTFTLKVTDSQSVTASKNFNLTIYAAPTINTTSPLTQGEVDIAYSKTLDATGGVGSYTWTQTAGTLPTGLTFSTGGVLYGVPTTAGTYSFTFRVTDALGATNSKAFTHVIAAAPSISTPAALTGGSVNIVYSQTLAATGGVGSYTWTQTAGTLPPGLSLTSGGILSGTPTTVGSYTFTIQVKDNLGATAARTFTLAISAGLTITTDTPLTQGEINIAYSQTMGVAGGVGSYTWTQTSGTLPTGLTFTTAGKLSGTPTAAGTYTFTLRVTDSQAATANKTFTLNIAAALSISTTTPLTQGEVNIAYSKTLDATGGVGSYTWTQTAGTLTPGLNFSTVGVLSGTPTTAGTYSFTFRVTDALGATNSKAFTHVIAAAPSISTPSALTGGSVNIVYSQTLAATGGVGSYTWTQTAGTLPPGLSLTSGGILSGTPTTVGSYTFTIQVKDNLGATAARTFTLAISAGLTITTDTPLTQGEINIAYSQTMGATGGVGSYTWTQTSGTLPTGLTFTTAGKLSGTPTAAGTYTFTLRVTDSQAATANKTFTLNIAAALSISTTTPLTQGEVNIAYSKTLDATGGVGSYTWTQTAGTLTPGLNFSTVGVLSGTPTTAGTYSFTFRVTDALGATNSKAFTHVIAAAPSISTPSALTGGSVNIVYSQTLAATGGVGSYTWTQTAGTLPPGLSLTSGGILSGTPTTVGSYTFTIQVKDNLGATAARTFTLAISAGLTITTDTPLTQGEINIAYSQTMGATGGVGSYTWTQTSGTLPTGLTFTTAGKLSGTPTAAGTYTFTLRVTDSQTTTANKTFTLNIAAALSISTTSPLTQGEVNIAYSLLLDATGGAGSYTWTQTAGTLPPGLTFSTGGNLGGTPTTAGTYSFTFRVTDSLGATNSKGFTLVIAAALSITTASPLTGGSANTAYAQTLAATGGVGTFTWTQTAGTLPPGLNLSTGGVLSGTPTTAGTYTFTVQVTDSLGSWDNQEYNLTIGAGLTITTETPLTQCEINIAYSVTMGTSGGTTPYSWSRTSGTLPTGLTFTTAGKLSGTPTVSGTYTFTIKVTDGKSATALKTFILVIAEAPTVNTQSPMAQGEVNTAYSQQLDATGGVGSYTWIKFSGTLPPGLDLSTSGSVFGTPTTAGNYTFTAKAIDQLGGSNSKSLKITVIPGLTITTTSPLTKGEVGIAYSRDLIVTGGALPYTWTLEGVALASGLTIDRDGALNGTHSNLKALQSGLSLSTGGHLGGTPTEAGTNTFTVRVTDSLGGTLTREFSLTIAVAPSISTDESLSQGEINKVYTQTLAVTGGVEAFSWSVQTGSALPTGISLTAGGVLTGTPTVTGTYTFAIRVDDSLGGSATKSFTLNIAVAPSITSPSSLTQGAINLAYSQNLVVGGGVFAFTWTQTAGTLPPGLNLSTGGVLSGTPTATGTYTFTIRVTDKLGGTDSKTFTLIIGVGVAISTTSPLTQGEVSLVYSQTLVAGGGLAAYTWTQTAGTLPPGLTFSSGGVLSGTPTTAGSYTFTVNVTDSLGGQASREFSVVIAAVISISNPSPLTQGEVNLVYSQTLAAGGGVAAFTWTQTAGALPPGLNLSTGGVLSGTPTTAGSYSFTVKVTDSLGANITKPFTLVIVAIPSITTTSPLPQGAVDMVYSQTLLVSGGALSFTWTQNAGTLPPGLGLSTGGILSGTPTAAGIYTFTIQVTDSLGGTDSETYFLTINNALVITTTSLTQGEVKLTYSTTLAASGGAGTLTWTQTAGILPPGLTFSTAGLLGGTPTTAGAYTFTIQVTDSLSGADTQEYTLTIASAPSITTTSPLTQGEVNLAYSRTFTANGGVPAYSWILQAGALPDGLGISTGGILSGTPTSDGSYTFTVRVTDSLNGTVSKLFSLSVASALSIASTSPLNSGTVGIAYTQNLAASGGVSAYTWTHTSGTLPPGLSISTGGVFSGTPTAAGTYTFTLKVTDYLGASISGTFTATISGPPMVTTSSPAPVAEMGAYYSLTLFATGGTGAYTWSASGLPDGLDVSTDGKIKGIPTTSGDYAVEVTVKDSFSPPQSAGATIIIPIKPELQLSSSTLTAGLKGREYSHSLSASGGVTPYTWSALNLPQGLSIGAETGIISGTPAVSGSYNVSITVTDSYSTGVTDSKSLTLKVYMPYDANGNGVVDMGDVVKIQRIYLNLDPATPAADANGDGKVNTADILIVIKHILGLE